MSDIAYNAGKTLKKGAIPLFLVALVRIALMLAEQAGMNLDETEVWTIAGGTYAGVVSLINWLKHRKKK
jgi:hypothetical protein